MFKKVQIKFVVTTMSIILAIFIAVLGSINVIMSTVMQRQSKVILSKIATNINYDEKTSSFSFVPEGDNLSKPDDDGEQWELNPQSQENTTSESVQSETETETETSSETVTEENQVAETEITENSETLQQEPQIMEETPEDVQTESQPQQTEETSPETEIPTDEVTEPDTETSEEENIQTSPTYPTFPQLPSQQEEDWWWYHEPDDNYEEFEEIPDENYDDFWDDYDRGAFPNGDFNPNFYRDEQFNEQIEDNESIEELAFNGVSILDDYDIIVPSLMEKETVNTSTQKHIDEIPSKTIDSIDYFVIMADTSGNLLDIFNQDEFDTSLAQRYISSILHDGAVTGMIGSLQFYTAEKSNGTAMVFTDKSAEIEMLNKLIKTTFAIGSISFVLLSVLVVFLSRKSIEPVKKAFEKQKQFVSDASHELKTPLTIISANADVLAGEIGDNKWLKYIQAQAERMSLLVNDLLNLTRIENNSADMTFSEFNLSQAVMNTALPFECQAFETHKKFDVDVEENLTLVASERHCKQLFAIFIDNAIKHSDTNGEVKVSLKKQGDKKIFSVYNTGSGIRDDEKDKIFERFYRSDDSRSRSTGGYGLGLAIAKSIVDYHKFKLTVDNVQGKYIRFTITM